jgi:hypothetical protein
VSHGPRRKHLFQFSPFMLVRNVMPSNVCCLQSHYLATALYAIICIRVHACVHVCRITYVRQYVRRHIYNSLYTNVCICVHYYEQQLIDFLYKHYICRLTQKGPSVLVRLLRRRSIFRQSLYMNINRFITTNVAKWSGHAFRHTPTRLTCLQNTRQFNRKDVPN